MQALKSLAALSVLSPLSPNQALDIPTDLTRDALDFNNPTPVAPVKTSKGQDILDCVSDLDPVPRIVALRAIGNNCLNRAISSLQYYISLKNRDVNVGHPSASLDTRNQHDDNERADRSARADMHFDERTNVLAQIEALKSIYTHCRDSLATLSANEYQQVQGINGAIAYRLQEKGPSTRTNLEVIAQAAGLPLAMLKQRQTEGAEKARERLQDCAGEIISLFAQSPEDDLDHVFETLDALTHYQLGVIAANKIPEAKVQLATRMANSSSLTGLGDFTFLDTGRAALVAWIKRFERQNHDALYAAVEAGRSIRELTP